MQQYLRKLQVWRNRYEAHLELRPKKQPLDLLSHWLVEFQHAKFDEIEIPGQYLEVGVYAACVFGSPLTRYRFSTKTILLTLCASLAFRHNSNYARAMAIAIGASRCWGTMAQAVLSPSNSLQLGIAGEKSA